MTPREAKRFIAALRSPLTRQFIDTSKLLMSSQFDEAAEFAISQRFALNDITFIHALLDVFSTSPSYAALLHWFCDRGALSFRSEEHTSELQSLMRISYAVFCLKKKKKQSHTT